MGINEQTQFLLAVDGGGIRGIVAAMILADFESRTGHHTTELFDAMAGTSTGALIVLGLSCPDPVRGGPLYSAQDLVQVFIDHGQDIFHHGLLQVLTQLVRPRYRAKGLEHILKRLLGDTMLEDAIVDVLVPAYDITNNQPWFFRSARARVDPSRNFPMRVVGRATTAAPVYFPPMVLRVTTPNGTTARVELIDGGDAVNSPAEALILDGWIPPTIRPSIVGPAMESVFIVSVGTGVSKQAPLNARNWGALRWLPNLFRILLDANPQLTDFQLRQLLPAANYNRLQTTLHLGSPDLDNVTPENLANLQRDARRFIAEHNREIQVICDALVEGLRVRNNRALPGRVTPTLPGAPAPAPAPGVPPTTRRHRGTGGAYLS